MRITNSMMINNTLRDLNTNMNTLSKYSSQLASNRKIVRLSDDPIGVINSLSARQQLRNLQQYRNNIVSSEKWVQQSETALTDMLGVIHKIKEEVINAGGVKNPEDKHNIAVLVKELKEHLIETCNSSLETKYIFAGFNSTKKPFTVDENGNMLYNGINLADVEAKHNAFDLSNPDILNIQWDGDIYPIEKYTIDFVGPDTLRFSNADGSVVKDVTLQAPVAGENTILMENIGLGTITYTVADPPPSIQDIAEAIIGAPVPASGSVESNMYELMTDIVTKNTLNATPDPNVAGLTWDGPITNMGKFYVQADGNNIVIRDSNGYKITEETITDATGPQTLDLTAYGLGTITWTNSAGTPADQQAAAEAVASALQDIGYVTTVLGDEMAQDFKLEIGYQLTFDVAFTGIDVVGLGSDNMFKILDELIVDLENGEDNDVLTTYLGKLTKVQDRLLDCIVESGARTNRLETMDNRYSLDLINAEAIRTNVEDIDQAYAIMQYKFSEAIYQQALAAGARVIQPSLMDFLR